MAHNLAVIRGKVAMAYNGASPWHRLGTKLNGTGETLASSLEAASLNYQVSLAPMYLADGRKVDCRQAVLRDESIILGTVGKGYTVSQNAEALGVVEVLIGEGGMTIETAGALGEGEVAWLMLKNHSDIKIGSDIVKPYLLVKTSHDGTSGVSAVPTAVRVVCQNTLNMVKDRATISVKHTQSIKDKLAEAKRILGSFGKAKAEAERLYSAMASTPLSLAQLADYWQEVFPGKVKNEAEESRAIVDEWLNGESRNVVAGMLRNRGDEKADPIEERRDMVAYLLNNGKGAAGETVWGAYNAVTEFVDHVYVSRQDGTYRTHGAQSALFGGGAQIRDRAWTKALEYVN